MPTLNPRLTVTLSPSMSAVLSRLTEMTGQSKSSIIAEVLQGTQPVMERMIQVLEAADKAKNALRKEVSSGFEEAETALNEQLGLTMDMFHKASGDLIENMETISRRGAKKGSGGGTRSASPPSLPPTQPPYLTGGSQTLFNTKKTTKKSISKAVKTASKPSNSKAKG